MQSTKYWNEAISDNKRESFHNKDRPTSWPNGSTIFENDNHNAVVA